uniref:Prolyl 4-hydroxylase subunit alpha-1 n=1 Tax=Cajanus cajan TaxID=3821 RepID=A0A151R4Q0_CAJCA|nr:Prolyl 4-hydroxylase subunit alpha-1 [Cajanus cajan]
MAKTKQSRAGPRKSWWRLTVTMLVTVTFFTLILLALRILSASSALSKPNDLNSIARNTHISQGGEDHDQGERFSLVLALRLILQEHGEGLQVLHYEVGQMYVPHHDYFTDKVNTANGGQRIATMLMYLSDVEEGGETVFPRAKGNFSSVPWWNELSECGKKGLSIKPKMGDALLFWSLNPDATYDLSSLHGSCPVIKGNKWSCTKWLRVGEY